MELVSPVAFLYAFIHSPLSPKNFGRAPNLSLKDPATILAGLYLVHYINRAVISPLRSPSRSKSHITVPIFGIIFNVVNGCLMGSYLSSPQAAGFLEGALLSPRFLAGVSVWAIGFAGNILHDEVLLNIRRQANCKGKARAKDDADDNNGKNKQEHYSIPYGYLYSLISFPNYFCEWVEWAGFAFAAAPLPSLFAVDSYCPPWVFILSEVLLMFPRAYRGHQWYHTRFPDYPKERKAAIPFLL